MRGDPQSGFASAMVRTSLASSELTLGRPTRPRRDFQVQKARNPCRCQRITVWGRTTWSASRHPAHWWESHSQKRRSRRSNCGRFERRRSRTSCCLRCQIFEREVSAGSERRTQCAQQRWDEEAAPSDRADSLPVLTHSTVQGENGHVGMYHCGDWMRSGRQAEHSVHSSGGRQSRTTEIHQDGWRSVSDLLLLCSTGPCGDRSGRAFAVGERASGRARPSSDGGKCSTSEADFSERLEIRPGGRGIAGTSWQGRRGAARANSPSKHGSTGGFGGAKNTRRIGGVPDETNQHLSGIGEELRRTTSPVQRREFPPSSKGVRSCRVKAGAGASISDVRANRRGDSEGRQTGGKTGQKVSGRRGHRPTERSGNSHRAGFPPHAGRQESVQVESTGWRICRVAAEEESVRRGRPAAADYESGRSILEKAAGSVRQLHARSLREGQRLEALGLGASETGWKERTQASMCCCCSEDE